MSRLLKTVVVLALIAFAARAIYMRVVPHGPPPGADMAAMMNAPPPVGVAAAVSREVQLWHEFSGRLSAVDRAEIRPRVSGAIDAVHFIDGAQVAKGDLLFTIDQRPYAAEVNRAQGALASAEAQAKLSRTEAERSERLLKEKAVSQRDFDEKQNALSVAEANLKSAQAALEAAQLNLDYTEIRAPIAGRVGRAEVTEGNLVGQGQPVLTTIVSANPIYADFEMDEATFLEYSKFSGKPENIPVELGLATETGTPHTGHIESFDNALDNASGTIRVRAVFDNEDGALVPGLFARLLVGSAAPVSAVLIDDSAIGTDQNKKFVMVVGKDNKVEYREISPGPMADGLRVVDEGLNAGEKIVVSGLQRARAGMPVKPEMVEMGAAK
jgi:multidrug efflux system membrane fusion protein